MALLLNLLQVLTMPIFFLSIFSSIFLCLLNSGLVATFETQVRQINFSDK